MRGFVVTTALPVIVAAVTLAALFISPGTASAAVGGCAPHIKTAGFDIGVCISDRGSANPTIVYSDIYVNSVSAGPNSCTIYVEQWHYGTKVFQDGGHQCTVGHDDAILNGRLLDSVVPGCLYLHSSSWMTLNGTFYRIGDSPTYAFGDSC